MNTKTCKKCGWVYPAKTPYTTCRFCGRAFTDGICRICGEPTDDLIPGPNMCRKCYNKQNAIYQKRVVRTTDERQKHYRQLSKDVEDRFNKWCERLKGIRTHTLTEAEWLEACGHFGGCALCDNEDISARGYFIAFEDGGRYNACNVIPLCEKCATDIKYQTNPFRRLNPTLNRNLATSRGLSVEKLERAAEYLQSKMEDIVDEL